MQEKEDATTKSVKLMDNNLLKHGYWHKSVFIDILNAKVTSSLCNSSSAAYFANAGNLFKWLWGALESEGM